MKSFKKNYYLCLLAGLLILAGCSGQYGRLSVNDSVKNQIENYQVLPDHNYYYSGAEVSPRAIIGIHKDYTLKSDLWKPVELTPDQLKKWMIYFGSSTTSDQPFNGSEILTPDGNRIGIWYAFKDWRDWASVAMIDEKMVNISTPIEKHTTPFHWFSIFPPSDIE